MTERLPPLEVGSSGHGSGRGGGSLLTTAPGRQIVRAWENFATGEDVEQGVRPEILASWYRCRDQYEVDPALHVAPDAPNLGEHWFHSDVLFAELGGLGALAGREVEPHGGVVAVTDAAGRILGSWGDSETRRRAALSNLAPWSSWSEHSTGTNGMGTALQMPGPVTVTGPEHWCEGFHQWACAGISIRDVVTGNAVAAINISRWDAALSDRMPEWLRRAAASIEAEIYRRAVTEAQQVVAEFRRESAAATGPMMVVDRGANVIAANHSALGLLRLTAEDPVEQGVLDPTCRWQPDIAGFVQVVRWAFGRALDRPEWRGFARLAVCPGEEAMPIGLRPIVVANNVVGLCCLFGSHDGEPYERVPDASVPGSPRRVIGLRHDRLVLLTPGEIRYAEADRNIVWLSTDRGRVQAATRGLDNVEELLAPHGFCRVHRRFLVNLRRVAELERGIKGELVLITDPRANELVPVSRRHAPEVRRLLGV